jgi:hypothetical protein
MTLTVQGVSVPDSKLTHEITELVRDTESPLLFHPPAAFITGAAGRTAPRADVRCGTALHRGDVPRHGADAAIQHHA